MAPPPPQDNKRPENQAGPSYEWWHGLFAGEDTLDTKQVSVEDYVRPDQMGPEQRRQAEEKHRTQVEYAKAGEEDKREKEAAKEREEVLPQSQKEVRQ